MQLKSKHRQSVEQSNSRTVEQYNFDALSEKEILQLFPLPRYFQIHYSYMHENSAHMKSTLKNMTQQAERIEQKLDRLLAMIQTE